MLVFTFLYAGLLAALALTSLARGSVGDAQSLFFFTGAVTICALFALKSPRHGFVGATVLALLIIFTASSRAYHLVEAAPSNALNLSLNIAALVLSLAYLIAAHGAWQRYRRRVSLEEMMKEDKQGS